MSRSKSKRGFDAKFTAVEARHILKAEGGELTRRELVIQTAWILAIACSLAWAIVKGNATAWHLGLPMLAEYLACVLLVPILSLIYRNPELKKETVKCAWWIAVVGVIGGVWLNVAARSVGISPLEQFQLWSRTATEFVFDKQVHWAMLIAAFHAGRNMLRNVHFLLEHGPPFLGPGMGCGMRIAVLFLALVIVPAFGMLILGVIKDLGLGWKPSIGPGAIVWLIWGLYVSAEILTLWFLWDIQNRLQLEKPTSSESG